MGYTFKDFQDAVDNTMKEFAGSFHVEKWVTSEYSAMIYMRSDDGKEMQVSYINGDGESVKLDISGEHSSRTDVIVNQISEKLNNL